MQRNTQVVGCRLVIEIWPELGCHGGACYRMALRIDELQKQIEGAPIAPQLGSDGRVIDVACGLPKELSMEDGWTSRATMPVGA
jgi:hypothetical protein